MPSDTVFVVEERHYAPRRRETRWNKVYLSRDKARQGVEYWAAKIGVHRLSWHEASFGVLIAECVDGTRDMRWTILPLQVHPENEPEEQNPVAS